MSYNVAGLPQALSGLRPLANLPVVGKLLNHYDVALVQEDFAYAHELRRYVTHRYQTPAFERDRQLNFGDGLSVFSKVPFSEFTREAWTTCNGYLDAYFDCWTPKGFSFARHELAKGVLVDVYNVHFDAGGAPGDRRARAAQLVQLAAAIIRHSQGRAVIVAGDTNVRSDQRPVLRQFEEGLALLDVCDTLRCPEPGRIDRFFYRSAPSLELMPSSWQTDSRFIDSRGRPLSDHLAVAVTFTWRAER